MSTQLSACQRGRSQQQNQENTGMQKCFYIHCYNLSLHMYVFMIQGKPLNYNSFWHYRERIKTSHTRPALSAASV